MPRLLALIAIVASWASALPAISMAVVVAAAFWLPTPVLGGTGDTGWMLQAKYGVFVHYQHRILLGYSHGTAALGTKPQLPPVSEMTAQGWNRFVDGFDVQGFADQMAAGQAGWVLFCLDDLTSGDSCTKQDLTRLTPKNMPAQGGILWQGKIYCGNVYHGHGDANRFSDQELIDWINTCNRQGGVCTLDWPLDPQTGLLQDFGIAQLKRIARAVKGAS
jgi:hypothetical protein